MACPTPADVLRAKTEDLIDTLYLRASWKSPWLGAIPRGEYPQGSGYVRSTFTVGRSEPTSDEETWETIAAIAENNTGGACGTTYNAVTVGELETTVKPAKFGLKGPLA